MEERIKRGTLVYPLWTISEILICATVDGYQVGGTRTEIQIQSLFHTKVLNKDPQITLSQHLIGLLMARAPHWKKLFLRANKKLDQSGACIADSAIDPTTAPHALDPDSAKRLWALSERLVGQEFSYN